VKDLPPLPTCHCPYCGSTVPDSPYCGACGSDLIRKVTGRAKVRTHAFAACPNESILMPSIVTTLFPQLSWRATVGFRIALGLFTLALLGCALAGATGPVIAVSALGVPLLFQIYVYEVDPYQSGALPMTAALLTVGAACGAGWALLAGPMVAAAAAPTLLPLHLTGGQTLRAGIGVPVVGQILMCLPVAVIRLRRPWGWDALDGFTAGATTGVGFAAAVTVVEMSSWMYLGQFAHQPTASVLAQAILRGISVPVAAAALTGYVGATLFAARPPASIVTVHRTRIFASPVTAIVIAVVLQAGRGVTDVARLPVVAVVLLHLAATLLAIIALRAGLHWLLLLEGTRTMIGPPWACTNCHHMTPVMLYCAQCGMARRATARSWRMRNPPPGGLVTDIEAR
jgi:RsiW-degrading membrane proteinase PrsW (M82 family)